MYPRIPWKLFADPFGSAQHNWEPLVERKQACHNEGLKQVLRTCCLTLCITLVKQYTCKYYVLKCCLAASRCGFRGRTSQGTQTPTPLPVHTVQRNNVFKMVKYTGQTVTER